MPTKVVKILQCNEIYGYKINAKRWRCRALSKHRNATLFGKRSKIIEAVPAEPIYVCNVEWLRHFDVLDMFGHKPKSVEKTG